MCPDGLAKLEAHLRVAHEVAVLFAVVSNGDCRKPSGPDSSVASMTSAIKGGFSMREIEAVGRNPPAFSRISKDGLHYATCASSASGIVLGSRTAAMRLG